VSFGVHKEVTSSKESTHGNARVEYAFTRVIAKRSISLPRFRKLRPVRRKEHVDNEDRWLVERFGNRICTTERYGGRAVISFTWQNDHAISAKSLKAKINALVTTGTVDGDLSSKWNQYHMRWNVEMDGFSRLDGVDYNWTSVAGARDLIAALKTLPITSAVPVGTVTVPVGNVSGFPSRIKVETHIRDHEMLHKIADVMQRLEQTGHHTSSAFMFAEDVVAKIEDASYNNRALLPQLRDIVTEMIQALSDHGKCVHLYKSGNESRLYKDKCSKKSVTSAGQVAAVLTGGLSIPVTLLGQKPRWNQADVWTLPENYRAVEFTRTDFHIGIYYRGKSELLFDNDELVSKWQTQVSHLFANTTSTRPSRPRRVWARIVAFCHCCR
jgi:hypothetical protein